VRFGKLNKEIAYELHLSEGTVKEYMNRIFRKLEVKNRTELAVWALMQKIAAWTARWRRWPAPQEILTSPRKYR